MMLTLLNNPIAFQIIIASILDIMLADPYWFPHPVKGIGKIINYGETMLRFAGFTERLGGIILTVFVTSISYFSTLLVINICLEFGDLCKLLISAVLIYFTLSIKGLVKEAKKIILLLENDDLQGARRSLANIVGRDTGNLDKSQIQRACIESIAENIVDGVLSSLFYAFIGGAPLAMAYKAINTLDSMIGYKNERYLKFGWAGARLDDVANYLPARISRFFIPLAALICGANVYKSLTVSMFEGHKHPSPNSGISEAAFAGALGIRLGGESTYNGVVSNKPFIGDEDELVSIAKMKKAIHLVYATSFIAIFFGIVVLTIVNKF